MRMTLFILSLLCYTLNLEFIRITYTTTQPMLLFEDYAGEYSSPFLSQ